MNVEHTGPHLLPLVNLTTRDNTANEFPTIGIVPRNTPTPQLRPAFATTVRYKPTILTTHTHTHTRTHTHTYTQHTYTNLLHVDAYRNCIDHTRTLS